MADALPGPGLTVLARARRGVGRAMARATSRSPLDGAPVRRIDRAPAPARATAAGEWLTALRAAMAPWLVSRALVAVGALTAVIAADRLVSDRPVPLDQGLLAWDGAAYRDIAAHGYGSLPPSGLRFYESLFRRVA